VSTHSLDPMAIASCEKSITAAVVKQLVTMNGSSDNATVQMCWRVDEKFPEFDYAFIFNGRRDGAGHDQIQTDLKQVFTTLLGV
jgi:hypothetical protein